MGCIFWAKFGRRGGLIPWPNRDGRTILTVPLDATSQQHHNQLATALARAETAGGWRGGFAFRRGESMYFRRSGGWATGAILAPCGRFRLFRLMPPPNDITINWRPRWRGLKWPGDGVAALFLEGGFCQMFYWRVGFKASLNCNRAGELDRTAQSTTSTTPQSTSVRGGGGCNGRGMAWRHCF